MRAVLCAAALATLCASGGRAAAQADPTTYRVTYADANVRLPMRTFRDRQYAGVVRQQYDFSCGSAALATLLTYHYGRPHTEQDVFGAMWASGEQALIRERGFSLLDMKRYLAELGLASDGYAMPIEKLEEIGIPAIALIDQNGYRHFVVVKGVLGNKVLIGDPARGLVARDREAFARMWDGTVFFLKSEVKTGQAAWNLRRDWRAFPQGRPADVTPQQDLSQEVLLQARSPFSGFALGPAAGLR